MGRTMKINKIDGFLPYLLAQASTLVSRQVDEIAAGENISRNECKVMLTLINNAGISLNQLAEIMIIKQPTLSRIVDAMVERGWLERRVLAEDRRAVELSLTPAGRKKAEPLLTHARKLDTDIAQQLGDGETIALKQLLNHLIRIENS